MKELREMNKTLFTESKKLVLLPRYRAATVAKMAVFLRFPYLSQISNANSWKWTKMEITFLWPKIGPDHHLMALHNPIYQIFNFSIFWILWAFFGPKSHEMMVWTNFWAQKSIWWKVISIFAHFQEFAFEIWLTYGKWPFSRRSTRDISATDRAFSIP